MRHLCVEYKLNLPHHSRPSSGTKFLGSLCFPGLISLISISATTHHFLPLKLLTISLGNKTGIWDECLVSQSKVTVKGKWCSKLSNKGNFFMDVSLIPRPILFWILGAFYITVKSCDSELEKAARDACGHFTQNHALLRTFWAYDPALLSRF